MDHDENPGTNAQEHYALVMSENIKSGSVYLDCRWESKPSQAEVQEWFDVYPHGKYPIHPEQYAEDCPWHPATVDPQLRVFDQHGNKVARVVCFQYGESMRRKRGSDTKMRWHRKTRMYIEVAVWDDSPYALYDDEPAARIRLSDEGLEIMEAHQYHWESYSWNQILKRISLSPDGPLPAGDEE
jgi:hypothetical protein